MNKFALKRLKIKIMIFFGIAVCLFVFFDFQFRPMIKSVSSSKARMLITDVVNEAVTRDMKENGAYYADIVVLSKNKDEEIIAVSANMEKINKLKSHISLLIQDNFYKLKDKQTTIAFGTLTGWELLNGKGPPIPLKISASGSVNTDIKSDFLNSGINQTLHRIYITVHSKISVVMPGCSCVTEVGTTVLAAETVIVGKVPNFYGGSAPPGMCAGNTDIKENE